MLFLAMLVATAAVRYGVTDLVATVRGTESPRHRERQRRLELAHQREMARLQARQGPTIGEAVAGRIASRIAEPKPPRDRSGQRPARAYFGRLWEDSWNDAVDRHERRHERAKAGDLPRQRAARKAREAARLRWDRYQTRRREQAGGQGPAASWTAERADPVDEPGDEPHSPQDDVVDAEIVDDEPPRGRPEEQHRAEPSPAPTAGPGDDPQDGPAHEPDPPTPAAQTPLATVHPITHTEGDITTMTAPTGQNLTSGETVDPESALAFSQGIGNVAQALYAELETSVANLTELGVKGAPIDKLASMQEAAQTLVSESEEASQYFSGHAEIADVAQSDETVGGGRYIGIGS